MIDFLVDTDSTLAYQVVSIADMYGPTKTDLNLEMIVVSAETRRGGDMVNELRAANGLNQLDVHCIELVELESDHADKELKVSSSNQRMDLLGSKLKAAEVISTTVLNSVLSTFPFRNINRMTIPDKTPPGPGPLRNRSDRGHRLWKERHDEAVVCDGRQSH